MGTSQAPRGGGCLEQEVSGHLTYRASPVLYSAAAGPAPKGLVERVYPFPAPHSCLSQEPRRAGEEVAQRRGDSKEQPFREEKLGDRPGREDLQKSQ